MQTVTNNPIAWAAIQLQGGWKNILLTTAGYAGFLVVVVMTGAQFATIPVGLLFYNFLVALLAVQGAWLLIFAPSRIQAAIRRDVTGGMIESHRLMPVPPTGAVTGYLFGATAQATSLVIATFLVGCFLAHGSGVVLPRWIITNFLLLEFAILVWFVMGAAALQNAQAAFLTLFVMMPMLVNGNLAHALPGAVVLVTPLTGKTVFHLSGQLERVHLIGFALHAAIITIFLRAAARKYVRSSAAAITPAMGMALLACWAAASIIGMHLWDEARPTAWGWRSHPLSSATLVWTTVAGVLLAVGPLTQVVRTDGDGGGGPRRRPWQLVAMAAAVVLLATALCIAPAATLPGPSFARDHRQAMLSAATAVGLLALSVCLLARAFYVQGLNAWLAVAIWLALTCVGPIAYDAGHHALLGDGSEFEFGHISDMSPLGTLHAVWVRGEQPAWTAPAVQGVFVALAGALLLTSWGLRDWRAGRATVAAEPSH